jgi:hypothetical protein
MRAAVTTKTCVPETHGAPTSRWMTPAPAISTAPGGAAKIIARAIPAIVVIAGLNLGIE